MAYSRFAMADAEERARNVASLREMIALAADLGCPLLRIFGGVWQDVTREQAIGHVVDGVRQVVADAEQAGVRMVLETHDDWCKGENVKAVMDGVGSPALGICWDIANATAAEPLEETFALVKDHIHHVHFKDLKRVDGKDHPCLCGQGEVALETAARLLVSGGYAGYLSFEWEKKWHPEIEDADIALPHYVGYVTDLLERVGE
jgi:sugar phosphate isomerase/epimerase